MFNKKVACNPFVKRQTKESGHSHFEGSWEQLESLVAWRLEENEGISLGYRDGVVLVNMSPNAHWFRSGVVKLTNKSKLVANYTPRREGEVPFIRVACRAKKQVAKYASVVLYRHDVLEENNERETDAEWEIVAIKARTSEEEDPMDPYTMARNFLHLKGGTKGNFTAEQFAQSIVYWNNHVMCASYPKWLCILIEFYRKHWGK